MVHKRWSLVVVVFTCWGALWLGGCGSTGPGPECKQSEDCDQGVCLEGACVACGTADDCDPGYACEQNQCVATCEVEGVCSGHGACDDASGTVVCTCDQGYAGEDCGACAEGYTDYGDGACRPEDPCAADTTCASRHRACENQQGEAVCGDCLDGYHPEGDDCVEDLHCGADSCSGHGSCDDSSGVVVCTCDQGYTGEHCGSCAAGYMDYGDGSCLPIDPCAGDTACAQEHRQCVNQQGEPICGSCLPGYHEEEGSCVLDTSCGPESCAGHGACDDSGGEVVCTCDPGYTGTHCEQCADGHAHWPPDGYDCIDDPCDPDPCTGEHAVAGSCRQTGEQDFACDCEEGYQWHLGACGPPCDDQDGDGYGEGPGCLGSDCDDAEPSVHEGATEVCDGLDNDCNDVVDDGGAEELCSPLPDHVLVGTCTPQGCVVADPATDCEEGWWDANGLWQDGCEAEVDTVPGLCAEAREVPAVSDAGGGQSQEVSGNLVPRGDEDWYLVTAIDESAADEEADECDDFKLHIELAAPDGTVLDVYRDDCRELVCSRDTVFDYDYSFHAPEGPSGQCPCRVENTEGFNICAAEDQTFRVRVHRLAGYPDSIEPYTLTISNGM